MQTQFVPKSPPEMEEIVTHPDVSHLVTEDDTPVDNPFSEQQMRLLTHPLYASWKPAQSFVAMANVGLYFSINGRVMVPDTLVSLGVERPADLLVKHHRAYFTWVYGKVPDIVVEIVSNREGGELDRKMRDYSFHGIPYYAVFDPGELLQQPALQCFEIDRSGSGVRYRPLPSCVFKGAGLGLVEWEGEFEGVRARWVRWVDADGKIIPTGEERAAAADRRAEALAARLRAAGIDPDSIPDA